MTTYKDAGVDIKSTDALVENISSLSKATNRKGNVDGIGGFGGIFDLKKSGFLYTNKNSNIIFKNSISKTIGFIEDNF